MSKFRNSLSLYFVILFHIKINVINSIDFKKGNAINLSFLGGENFV